MTEFLARYEETGNITAGPMDDGEIYSGIDEGSRFWAVIQKWLDSGHDIQPPQVVAPSLDEAKASLKKQIDEEAEATRLRYITGGAGQAMTYQQKATEAMACLAEVNPQMEDYPLLSAEIGITAETLLGVAQVVFEAHQGWRQIGGMIEGLRLGGKQAVDAAETVKAAHTAAQIVWP